MADPEREDGQRKSNLAMRVGLAGALGVGALVTGFILTRSGRRLVGDVLAGRSRTPLEGRVLDALWSDRVIGRRRFEVRETSPGCITVIGTLGSDEERGRALAIAESAKGVKEVEPHLAIDERKHKRRSTD